MEKDDFAERVMEKSDMLYRIARTLLQSEEDCRDALSEAILKAWERRHTLREDAHFATWITRILINECYAQLRKQKRTAAAPVLPQTQDDSGVMDALYALPEALRLPVTLHYVEGYSVNETAKLLRLPQSTIRGRLSRARQALRMELSESCNENRRRNEK